MSNFDKDEFEIKIFSMYPAARENNYILRLNEEQIEELKAIYLNVYIPMEALGHYNDEQIMKKMMTAIVSISKMDKEAMSNSGEVIQLVNTVKYDGRYLYLNFAKISPIKMRRFEIGMSQKQVAEKMGCSISTVRNCEESYCDLSRQPEKLVHKLANALKCEPGELMA